VNGSVERDLRRVQVRITALATVALLAILAVAGYALTNAFERELLQQVDARLDDAADHITQIAARNTPLPTIATPDDLVQIVNDDASIVFASAALRDEPPLWDPSDGERAPRSIQTDRHGELRITAVRFHELWVVLGEPLQPVHDAVQSLQRAMLVGLPLLALALAALVWFVVGRTLRPVGTAIAHEEQLVADVTHELRSPLAGLRLLLETEPREGRGVELSRIEALATLGRLEAITDQLLLLAREDQPPDRATRHPVDLDELVIQRVQALASRAPVRLDTTDVAPGQVLGREDELASMVENLLTNAMRHAATRVRVSLREQADTVELAVDDDGPGVDPRERERIFERFTRLDEARSRDGGGAGLGLAIVRAIVDAHGGSVAVHTSELGGARFVVRLPASTPDGSTPAAPPGPTRPEPRPAAPPRVPTA
jgi:signal transduction histidine kinase